MEEFVEVCYIVQKYEPTVVDDALKTDEHINLAILKEHTINEMKKYIVTCYRAIKRKFPMNTYR